MDKERWRRLSLGEQIGHVTSEIARARGWEERRDVLSRNQALERALELIDLTLCCTNGLRRRELARFREVLCDCFVRSGLYQISLLELERYGLSFIRMA